MNQLVTWLTSFKKECPVCTGTGTIPCNCNENNENICPNCGGEGVVKKQKTITQKVEMPCDNPLCQNGKVVCGACNGTGKNGQGDVCEKCHGKGQVDCSVCSGIGRITRVKQESWMEPETCHICNGRGVVPCYHCHGTKERVCPECKGKGTVLNRGKLLFFASVAVLIIANPIFAIAVMGVVIGWCVFKIWHKADQEEETAYDSPDESEEMTATVTEDENFSEEKTEEAVKKADDNIEEENNDIM